MGDESDNDDKKKALNYLENAAKYKESFVRRTMDNFGERINKNDLC
jgi:hypothetical protein